MKLLHTTQQVIVADDNPNSRRITVEILRRSGAFNSILEVSNGISILVELKKETPNMIITGISMPRMGGLELINYVKETNPFVKIIALTNCRNKKTIKEVMASGADGFICKDDSLEVIESGIINVLNGERFISPRAIEIFNQVTQQN